MGWYRCVHDVAEAEVRETVARPLDLATSRLSSYRNAKLILIGAIELDSPRMITDVHYDGIDASMALPKVESRVTVILRPLLS